MKGPEMEAVLLFRQGPDLDCGDFLRRLNTALADLAITFEGGEPSGEELALFQAPSMHLRMSQSPLPLPVVALAEALEAAEERGSGAALADVVENHRATLTLSLGEGRGRDAARPGRRVAPEIATMVLARAVRLACEMAKPAAAFWGESQMLFTPEEIISLDPRRFPARLVFRPEPIESESLLAAPGVRARHSELFCGRQLVIPPGRMELEEAIHALESVIERHVVRDTCLSERVVIPISGETQLRVSLCDDLRLCPTGCFLLEPEPLGTALSEPRKPEAEASRPSCPTSRRGHLPTETVGHGARSRALRTWALCAALATITPLGAGALFLWNLLRGPNLAVSAVAFALILAIFTGLSVAELMDVGNREIATAVLDAMGRPF